MNSELPQEVFYEYCIDRDLPQNGDSRQLAMDNFFGVYNDTTEFIEEYLDTIVDPMTHDLLAPFVDWDTFYENFLEQGHFHTIWNDTEGTWYVFYN